MVRPPFSNPDKYEEDFDFEMDRRPAPSPELIALLMQDAMNREQGKVAPDTTGADYFFLCDFITRDMEYDFPLIEQDFIKHCNGRLREFSDAGWYGELEHINNGPQQGLRKKIVRLIYNGAKLGDPYCVELIRYLYKTYHKKEYNQLKRFSTISTREIFSLSEDDWDGCSYEAMGRILGMCQFMGIKLNEDCSILFLLLDKTRKEWIEDDDEQSEYIEIDYDLFSECVEQVEQWNEQYKGDFKYYQKAHKEYYAWDNFMGMAFRNHGYRYDYNYFCKRTSTSLTVQMGWTLALLRTIDDKKEYTFEDVQRYTVLYEAVEALTDVADSFQKEVDTLLGEQLDYFVIEDGLFKPENIKYKQPEEKKEAVKKVITNVAPVSMGTASEEDYLNEIAELRKKVNEQDQENKALREQNRQIKKAQGEADKLISKYQSERDELVALRNFAYKSDQEIPKIADENLAEMQKAIADKAIVIIGGHINWINKLKKMFPKWMFIHPDSYKGVDGKMLENKEHVYFFTDYMNHISYVKFIAAVRERKIPFGYLGSRNVELLVKQIYDDLC